MWPLKVDGYHQLSQRNRAVKDAETDSLQKKYERDYQRDGQQLDYHQGYTNRRSLEEENKQRKQIVTASKYIKKVREPRIYPRTKKSLSL